MVGVLGSLTGVVRPFETPDVRPAAVQEAAPPNATVNQNAKLVIGRGAAKTFTGTFDLTISYYKVRKPKEKQR